MKKKPLKQEAHHPGYGEGRKFHDRKEENPLPDSETLTFALVGNQNCGKTTLFNQLTGSKQHVGNFPGVTVDRKDGVIRGYDNTLITDLPGIYSMSPYSSEEIVTREFVIRAIYIHMAMQTVEHITMVSRQELRWKMHVNKWHPY